MHIIPCRVGFIMGGMLKMKIKPEGDQVFHLNATANFFFI
jgi:hypothetical protein